MVEQVARTVVDRRGAGRQEPLGTDPAAAQPDRRHAGGGRRTRRPTSRRRPRRPGRHRPARRPAATRSGAGLLATSSEPVTTAWSRCADTDDVEQLVDEAGLGRARQHHAGGRARPGRPPARARRRGADRPQPGAEVGVVQACGPRRPRRSRPRPRRRRRPAGRHPCRWPRGCVRRSRGGRRRGRRPATRRRAGRPSRPGCRRGRGRPRGVAGRCSRRRRTRRAGPMRRTPRTARAGVVRPVRGEDHRMFKPHRRQGERAWSCCPRARKPWTSTSRHRSTTSRASCASSRGGPCGRCPSASR